MNLTAVRIFMQLGNGSSIFGWTRFASCAPVQHFGRVRLASQLKRWAKGTSCAATGWMTRRCICDETDTFHESVVATAATYITAGLTPFGAEVIALDMAFQTVDMYML